MRPLLEQGRVFAALPPLYSSKWRGETYYAFSDKEKDDIAKEKKVPLDKWVRFKGLGEMPPSQLKETTMNPQTRVLLKITLPKRDINEADDRRLVDELVNILMGKKPELRFKYIQENANLVDEYDI